MVNWILALFNATLLSCTQNKFTFVHENSIIIQWAWIIVFLNKRYHELPHTLNCPMKLLGTLNCLMKLPGTLNCPMKFVPQKLTMKNYGWNVMKCNEITGEIVLEKGNSSMHFKTSKLMIQIRIHFKVCNKWFLLQMLWYQYHLNYYI